MTSLAVALAAKRAEFLRELVPTASKLAFLINPTIDISQIEVERLDIEAAARALGWQLLLVHAGSVGEFDTAFATMVRERVGALIIATDTFFYSEMGALGACRTSCRSRGRSIARFSGSRRADELLNQHFQHLSAGRCLHRKSAQGRKACRLALSTANQIRACHQSQSGEGTRH